MKYSTIYTILVRHSHIRDVDAIHTTENEKTFSIKMASSKNIMSIEFFKELQEAIKGSGINPLSVQAYTVNAEEFVYVASTLGDD